MQEDRNRYGLPGMFIVAGVGSAVAMLALAWALRADLGAPAFEIGVQVD